MYPSQISSVIITGLLMCIVEPLHSDPQRSYNVPHAIRGYRPIDSSQPSSRGHVAPTHPKSGEVYHNYHRRTVPDAWAPQNYNQFPRKEDLQSSQILEIPSRRRVSYRQGTSDVQFRKSSRKDYESVQRYDPSDADDDIEEKMSVLEKILAEDYRDNDLESKNSIEEKMASSIPEETKRVVRQARKEKPGFFWTLARVVFETYNDTRSAVKQIGELVSNNIAPDTTTQEAVTSSSLMDQSKLPSNQQTVNATTENSTDSTTEAPYKFTRSGIQSLIRRNLGGLIRLFNIEWRDAINESEVTVKEFQKNLSNQIGMYLQDNPNAY